MNGKLERRKTRVVAKSYLQRPGIDFQETFAPVTRLGSLRLLITLSAQFGMSISQLDIIAAYLNSNMDSVVHMEIPEHLEEMLIRITLDKSTGHLRSKAKTILL